MIVLSVHDKLSLCRYLASTESVVNTEQASGRLRFCLELPQCKAASCQQRRHHWADQFRMGFCQGSCNWGDLNQACCIIQARSNKTSVSTLAKCSHFVLAIPYKLEGEHKGAWSAVLTSCQPVPTTGARSLQSCI
jgi:hypothetical protein